MSPHPLADNYALESAAPSAYSPPPPPPPPNTHTALSRRPKLQQSPLKAHDANVTCHPRLIIHSSEELWIWSSHHRVSAGVQPMPWVGAADPLGAILD